MTDGFRNCRTPFMGKSQQNYMHDWNLPQEYSRFHVHLLLPTRMWVVLQGDWGHPLWWSEQGRRWPLFSWLLMSPGFSTQLPPHLDSSSPSIHLPWCQVEMSFKWLRILGMIFLNSCIYLHCSWNPSEIAWTYRIHRIGKEITAVLEAGKQMDEWELT